MLAMRRNVEIFDTAEVDIRGKGTKENGRICFDGKVDAIIFLDKKLWIYLPVLKFWFRFLPFGLLPCL